MLRNCFNNPEALKPKRTRDDLTKEAADEFSALAQRLRSRGHQPEVVAHFVNRLVFCMFAEDVGLLPNKMFERAIVQALQEPEKAETFLKVLFGAMRSGGPVGFETVPWFNGGLFDDDNALPLDREDVGLINKAAKLYWADIDPSILGTLFERGLDPSKRSQLGAHYTDREKIMLIVRPVIVEPLEAEWAEVKGAISQLIDNAPKQTAEKLLRGAQLAARTKAFNEAERLHRDFTHRLASFRVLDPACGSGNFLYLSLKALKDIEHKANVEAEALGLPRGFPRVGPESVKGIEINPYAAELARVSIWIGEIQWMRANGFDAATNPILKPLDNIECRDAVLNADGTQAMWPDADVVVGNPPFLGDRKMRPQLGDEYVEKLRERFIGHVPGAADLVCYWFAMAREGISAGKLRRAGLVATNSIRFGANRIVLADISNDMRIYDAWPDEPWVVDGADVRVSIVCFGSMPSTRPSLLNGQLARQINSDLSNFEVDLTQAKKLEENKKCAFQGVISYGQFEIPGNVARQMLLAPLNPNSRSNTDVVKPWAAGDDIVDRPQDYWIIAFSDEIETEDAALYEAPFEWLTQAVRDYRQSKSGPDKKFREHWWKLWRSRKDFFEALGEKGRFLATVRHAKHRIFRWLPSAVVPDSALVVSAKDDDTFFGIVQSSYHEAWALRLASSIGVGNDPRYSHTSTFLSFPFPGGLTPNIPASEYAHDPRAQAIAKAAARLNELRENWLNPVDLVKRTHEVVPSYPDRILPVDDSAAELLKKRTLTNLYNDRPAWLDHAHRDLDRAVATAYGWQADFDEETLTDEEALKRLFDLNQARGPVS